jgi:two-component system chemotaxis sensor kinase CheA
MVVVRVGDRPAALAVDRLMDQQEVVVKSLGKTIGRAKGVAGASILGDGEVALILDVATLMKAA